MYIRSAFLIYINYIYKCSALFKFVLFADDTTVIFAAKTVQELCTIVNVELNLLSDWFKCNKLSLNILKTSYIIFRRPLFNSSQFFIIMDGNPIKQVTSTKFSGVEVDSDLS